MSSTEANEPPIRHVRRIEGASNWEVVPEPSAAEKLQHWLGLRARGVSYADQEIARLEKELETEQRSS